MTPRVLLVDDEANVLAGLRRALRREPYEIVCAASAVEALNILRGAPVDVVISDQEMPGMCGTEFLARVRELYPDTERIILTGKATLDVAVRAINDGAISRFITKPCRLEELAVTIRQAIERRRLLREAQRLLQIVRRQSDLIEAIERETPGITRVRRAPDGAVLIEEPRGDFDRLMEEIRAQAERAEGHLSCTAGEPPPP